jgi:excisionase family DNA binding protein
MKSIPSCNKVILRYNRTNLEDKTLGSFFENLNQDHYADENTRWLNTKEAAEFLRLTPNALRILVHRAQVKYFKFGRRLRFRQSDLQLLLLLQEN